jgi:hypothetical protein
VVDQPELTRRASRRHLRALQGYVGDTTGYQRLAYVVGAALVVVGLLHIGIGVATGESASGPLSWRKPATFGVSFGLTTATMAWVATYLPRRQAIGWTLAGTLAISTTAEVVWVSVQHARGVPAHFNTATDVDFAMFIGGAVAVGITIVVLATVAIASFSAMSAPAPMALAIRSGMVALLAAQAVGAWYLAHGLSLLDAGADPLTQSMSTYGAAGAMKFAHAVPMHAIQVLGAVALSLSFSNLNTRRQLRLVASAVTGYAGILAVVLVRTARGLSPFDLFDVSTVLYVIAGGLLLAPMVVAAGAAARRYRT